MNFPITSLLAGFMAIFIMALNVQLTIRQVHLGGDVFKNLSDGGGDDILIRRRIAFMSAVFNIPMSIILLGLIEFSGSSKVQVIILALTLIVSRVLHVIGCLYEPLPRVRTFAIMIQFGYFTVCGLWLMSGALYLIK